MRWIIVLLVSCLLLLQYQLWFGENSYSEVLVLKEKIRVIQASNAHLREENILLTKMVESLKNDKEALIGRAREELGLIRRGETFYRFITPPPKTVDE